MFSVCIRSFSMNKCSVSTLNFIWLILNDCWFQIIKNHKLYGWDYNTFIVLWKIDPRGCPVFVWPPLSSVSLVQMRPCLSNPLSRGWAYSLFVSWAIMEGGVSASEAVPSVSRPAPLPSRATWSINFWWGPSGVYEPGCFCYWLRIQLFVCRVGHHQFFCFLASKSCSFFFLNFIEV